MAGPSQEDPGIGPPRGVVSDPPCRGLPPEQLLDHYNGGTIRGPPPGPPRARGGSRKRPPGGPGEEGPAVTRGKVSRITTIAIPMMSAAGKLRILVSYSVEPG